jgi:hypothetical protein
VDAFLLLLARLKALTLGPTPFARGKTGVIYCHWYRGYSADSSGLLPVL